MTIPDPTFYLTPAEYIQIRTLLGMDEDDVICPDCGYPDWWVDNDCETCGENDEPVFPEVTPEEMKELDAILGENDEV